jgi:hypothetical protein
MATSFVRAGQIVDNDVSAPPRPPTGCAQTDETHDDIADIAGASPSCGRDREGLTTSAPRKSSIEAGAFDTSLPSPDPDEPVVAVAQKSDVAADATRDHAVRSADQRICAGAADNGVGKHAAVSQSLI